MGYFLPHEGCNDIAHAMIGFESLAAYEAYRARLLQHPGGKANFEFAVRKKFILRETREWVKTGDGMIAVIFEVWPAEPERYLDIAADLHAQLEKIDGFLSIERFTSLTETGKILSLSYWRDEEAVKSLAHPSRPWPGAAGGPPRRVPGLSPQGGAGAARLRPERPQRTARRPTKKRLSRYIISMAHNNGMVPRSRGKARSAKASDNQAKFARQ